MKRKRFLFCLSEENSVENLRWESGWECMSGAEKIMMKNIFPVSILTHYEWGWVWFELLHSCINARQMWDVCWCKQFILFTCFKFIWEVEMCGAGELVEFSTVQLKASHYLSSCRKLQHGDNSELQLTCDAFQRLCLILKFTAWMKCMCTS